MGHVQDNAEEQVRRVIGALDDGAFDHEMDDGAVINVRVTVDRETRSATIDFTGTSPQRPTNFNAPRSVTTAAVLYVFRCLIDTDIPLNAGCLRPLNIIVPEHSLLNPSYPAAVVAGNVETSQAVTDALFACTGRHGRKPRHDEQLHVRQRAPPILRNDLRRRGCGPDIRRRQRRSHAHDELAADRSRSAGVALSRPRSPLRRSRWLGRQGRTQRRRRRRCAKSSSAKRWRRASSPPAAASRPFGIKGGGTQSPAATRSSARRAKSKSCQDAQSVAVEPGDVFVIETPGGGGYGSTRKKQGKE